VASFHAVRERRPRDRDSARKARTQPCRRIIRREGSKPWQRRRKRRRWRSRKPESKDASARLVSGPALLCFVTAAGLESGRYCFVAHRGASRPGPIGSLKTGCCHRALTDPVAFGRLNNCLCGTYNAEPPTVTSGSNSGNGAQSSGGYSPNYSGGI
jgi:hypothetical protein